MRHLDLALLTLFACTPFSLRAQLLASEPGEVAQTVDGTRVTVDVPSSAPPTGAMKARTVVPLSSKPDLPIEE